MLLAIESTEVAKENQNGGALEQSAGMEDFALDCHELEVKIDPHGIMMRPPTHRFVIRITEERRLCRHSRGSL
jgi:hypothetical protein